MRPEVGGYPGGRGTATASHERSRARFAGVYVGSTGRSGPQWTTELGTTTKPATMSARGSCLHR